MAPHSSTLAWKIPWMEEPGRLQSIGLLRVRHDQVTSFMHWKRKWQPTPVILPGESQGRGSLVGCRLWGRIELDTTEATWQQQQQVFSSAGQSIRASASASALPMSIQDLFPLGLTGLISLKSKGLSIPQFKSINSSALSFLYGPTLISMHDYWKNHRFD